MDIRLAHAEDADAVATVYIESFGTLTFLPRLHTDDETRGWIASVVMLEHEVWFAKEEGRIVGMAAVSDDVLEQLYVTPDAHNRGVGSALLTKVKERRPNGFTLWTFQANTRARRFYERHGFRAVELTDGSGNMEREPDVRYEWRP